MPRLTKKQVGEMKAVLKLGYSLRRVAEVFGVCHQAVHAIKSGKVHARVKAAAYWLPSRAVPRGGAVRKVGRFRLERGVVMEVMGLLERGVPHREIVARFGMSPKTVVKIGRECGVEPMPRGPRPKKKVKRRARRGGQRDPLAVRSSGGLGTEEAAAAQGVPVVAAVQESEGGAAAWWEEE